jgi:uncharacterized protein (TIGR02217 family)
VSTTVWSFTVTQPYAEGVEHKTDIQEAQGGREARLARWPAYGLFRVSRAGLHFSSSRNTLSTFVDFFNDRQGRYDTFLYKSVFDVFNTVTTEDCGTGNGVLTDFALDSKYIDSSTLLVYVAGVLQSSGYSLINNNTTPTIRFSAAPTGAITATYEFYYPCRFEQDDVQIIVLSQGTSDTESVLAVQNITWRQDYSGSHLV